MAKLYLLNLDAPLSSDLNNCAEQIFDLSNKAKELFLTFKQNYNCATKVLDKFEIFLIGSKTGHIYNLCPIIPKNKVVLTQQQFQKLVIELKSQISKTSNKNALSTFLDKMVQSKQTLFENDSLCVLNISNYERSQVMKYQLTPSLQGPHKVENPDSRPGSKYTNLLQVSLSSQQQEVIDLAFLTVSESGPN